jgi:hypothetical protein
MTKKLSLLILILTLLTPRVHATNKKNHWLLITQNSDTLIVSRLDRIIDNQLFYTATVSGSILIDSITGAIHVRYPHYGRNIAIGAGLGFIAGAIVGGIAAPPEDPNSIFYGVSTAAYAGDGSLIGLAVGAFTGTAV